MSWCSTCVMPVRQLRTGRSSSAGVRLFAHCEVLSRSPIAVIALWLGHESIQTTHGYIEADLAIKEQALQKLAPARQNHHPIQG
jgi:hypothetical protein